MGLARPDQHFTIRGIVEPGCRVEHRSLIQRKGFSMFISLQFQGYWRESALAGVPRQSGIYVVYGGIYNPRTNTVDLRQLVYIGESGNVGFRLHNQEKRKNWLGQLGYSQQELFFSFAPAALLDRMPAEAALIYQHQPPVNDEGKATFHYNATRIVATGCNALLCSDFTIHPFSLADAYGLASRPSALVETLTGAYGSYGYGTPRSALFDALTGNYGYGSYGK